MQWIIVVNSVYRDSLLQQFFGILKFYTMNITVLFVTIFRI